MTRRHSSFLIRCWQIRNGIQRIEIEHIQSGEKTLVDSLSAALDWLSAHQELAPDQIGAPLERRNGSTESNG